MLLNYRATVDRFDSMRVFVKVVESSSQECANMPVIGIVACLFILIPHGSSRCGSADHVMCRR